MPTIAATSSITASLLYFPLHFLIHLLITLLLLLIEIVRLYLSHRILVLDHLLAGSTLNGDKSASQAGGARFGEDGILAPRETRVQFRYAVHFVQQRHLVDQVCLQKVCEVVGLVKWLEDSEA